MRKRLLPLGLPLVGVSAQTGCMAVWAGAAGAAVGYVIAENDDDD